MQVYSYESVNVWDDGYPSGGNYWSDYTGVDTNGDGIGDTPYVIDTDNVDHYPLMKAFFTDNIPPEEIMPYQNVTVTVNVTDLGTGVYNGTSWTPLDMTEISPNAYQATIPGHKNCTWVSYKIVAYDKTGLRGVVTSTNPTTNINSNYYCWFAGAFQFSIRWRRGSNWERRSP